MISQQEFLERQQRTRERMARMGYAAAIVVGRSFYDRCGHLAYLTNHFPHFPTSPFVDTTGGMGHGFLVLPVRGEPVLAVDWYREDMVAVKDVRRAGGVAGLLLDAVAELGLGDARVALVGADMLPFTMARLLTERFPGLQLQPADVLLDEQRMIKSEAEIALLRKAAAIGDLGLVAAAAAVQPGVTEQEVCAVGIAATLRAGADFVRYLRVHSGPWSTRMMRWPQAMDRKALPGELVALDLIGAYQGYAFDLLRTVIAEPAADVAKRLLVANGAVLDAAIAACLPGTPVQEVRRLAAAKAEELGYGQDFDHSFLGHGVGMETVEWPFVTPAGTGVLQAGMVLCLEPGINLPDGSGGTRMEDMVVVRDGEPEVLSRAPRLF